MGIKLDNLFTPGGRLVQGSLTEKGDKDHAGQLIPVEKRTYFFGVAVPKTTPGVSELIGQLYQMAATDYAQVPLVMAQIQQGFNARDFAWKIQDGDAQQFDKKTGQPKATPDYIKGCWVFKFNTQFEIGACDFEGRDIDRASIKKGDYVDVMFSSQCNGKIDATAGIYLNPNAIRRLGFGEAIASTVPASTAFAGRAASAPAGATQMPTAGGAAPMPGTGMPGPAPAGMPMAAPPAPAPAPAPLPPAAPVGPQRPADPTHIHAAGTPQEQWWINGAWTPAVFPAASVGMPTAPVGLPAAPTGPAPAGMPTASPSNGQYPAILGGMPGM